MLDDTRLDMIAHYELPYGWREVEHQFPRSSRYRSAAGPTSSVKVANTPNNNSVTIYTTSDSDDRERDDCWHAAQVLVATLQDAEPIRRAGLSRRVEPDEYDATAEEEAEQDDVGSHEGVRYERCVDSVELDEAAVLNIIEAAQQDARS